MQEVKMSAKNDLAVFALPVSLLKNARFRLQLNCCKNKRKKEYVYGTYQKQAIFAPELEAFLAPKSGSSCVSSAVRNKWYIKRSRCGT